MTMLSTQIQVSKWQISPLQQRKYQMSLETWDQNARKLSHQHKTEADLKGLLLTKFGAFHITILRETV